MMVENRAGHRSCACGMNQWPRKHSRRQQQRATQYKQRLPQQVHVVQQQTAQLQQQKRTAQYQVQQQYTAQLQQQQQRLQTARNYSNDPYISAPHTYRYTVSGATRQTNQYGADVLRQAVNYGYQQGYRSGQADRQDHWASNTKTLPRIATPTTGTAETTSTRPTTTITSAKASSAGTATDTIAGPNTGPRPMARTRSWAACYRAFSDCSRSSDDVRRFAREPSGAHQSKTGTPFRKCPFA
jgi:hypothetical protein